MKFLNAFGLSLVILFGLFALSSSATLQAQQSVLEKPNPRVELEKIAVIDQKVMMPMRDGIRLCTDIYRPKTDQPVPVIFSRTPYNFNSWRDGEERTRSYARALKWVQRGYAYVVQNERGRFFQKASGTSLAHR